MLKLSLPILVFGLLASADAKKDELKKLEGKWVLVSGEKDGKELSAEEVKAARLSIKGNKHTVHVGGDVIKGTHKLDASTSPASIDATDTEGPFKGKTTHGIYEVKGSEFKVCFSNPGKPRPKDFKSGDFVHVWKRAKK